MRKKILLPTDFSKNAWDAIVYATELYKNLACDFYIMNVFSVSGYYLSPEPGHVWFDEAKAKSEKGLGKTIERLTLRGDNDKHRYFAVSELNLLLEAILDFVEKQDINLVIMGTKGATNSVQVLYGTNAILIMEKVRNCPVMAIPEGIGYKEPKEIVFPTSYKTHFKRRELQYLVELAQISNATVRILHIDNEDILTEEQKENKQRLEEYFEDINYTFHTLRNVDVKSGLHAFVQSRGSDLITFINKKHSFFGSIFSQPMVKNLGQHSKVPVLALHDLRN